MINIKTVNMPEVLRYMGYNGQEISKELQSIIDEAVAECLDCIRPAYMYRLFPVCIEGNRISIVGSALYFE
ncbi:MAG: Vitamin B12 dependent methionine synthase, activation domain protein, partial [Clostridia bacterium]|nr:Vitamin B12 dependent methionine synthase, activation domain protein [Clostridia bacterium]